MSSENNLTRTHSQVAATDRAKILGQQGAVLWFTGLSGSGKSTLAYAVEREGALRVYLSDASVAIDTNHLERALRPIPMGRKNWLFCWTEVGAEHVGIVQSLICTCRLHGINPYTYLVDVLQRIAIHPDSAVEQLTPRVWKTLFADEPLRSDLALVTANQTLSPGWPTN